jgi:enoyl-CoA hydratase/carnithine racemase
MTMAPPTPSARAELDSEGALTVTLTRPEHRNPLDREAFAILQDAFVGRARTPEVRCAVLRGEGDHFCSGLDRAILGELGGSSTEDILREGAELQGVFDAIEDCPRPTLAVVQGACVGGGMALALACDFRVASEDAWFSLMEMRYAFLPDLGHIHRLQREVGLSRAKQLVYFAERVDAATLERWGVINEVVPRERLEEAAARWRERCLAAPPLAVAEGKRIMQSDPAGADGMGSQRAALAANAGPLLHSADFREGLTAALERRAPRFRGE